MNYNQDPFDKSQTNTNSYSSSVHDQLRVQDSHLKDLHDSLLQARSQTQTINAELAAHHELLDSLNGRMEGTVGAFEGATRRVRKLYAEMTEKRFTWTATFLIALLTVLLLILIIM